MKAIEAAIERENANGDFMTNVVTTKVIAARTKRLCDYARIISEKYSLKFELQDLGPWAGGYTDHVKICVTSDPGKAFFLKDITVLEELVIQKAITMHEVGHNIFTDKDLWIAADRSYKVDSNLRNIIEDGRVEEGMSRKFANLRKYFVYMNRKMSESQEFSDYESLLAKEAGLKALLYCYLHPYARMTTGFRHSGKCIVEAIHKMGVTKEDLAALVTQTRKAVECKTEKEAIEHSTELQKMIDDLCKVHDKRPTRNNVKIKLTGSANNSIEGGDNPDEMPDVPEDDEADIIIEVFIEEAEQIESSQKDNEKPAEDMPEKPAEESEGPTPKGKVGQQKDKKDKEQKDEDSDKEVGSSSSSDFDEQSDEDSDSDEDSNSDSSPSEKLEDMLDSVENETSAELIDENAEIENTNVSEFFRKTYLRDKGHVTCDKAAAQRLAHELIHIRGYSQMMTQNTKRGILDSAKIGRVHFTDRVFKRRNVQREKGVAVVILLDASGSMENDGNCRKAGSVCYIVSKAVEMCGFSSEIIAFSDDMKTIKSFNENVDSKYDEFRAYEHGGTELIEPLKVAEADLKRVGADKKIVFVITDGAPSCPQEVRKLGKSLEQENVIPVEIRISNRYYRYAYEDTKLFSNFVCVTAVEELLGAMSKYLRQAAKITA